MHLGPNDRCACKKTNGARCKAKPMVDSEFCFFHNPATASKRTEAQRAGGRRNKASVLSPNIPTLALRNVEDVVSLVADTINRTRCGQLDTRVGNTIGYLSGILLKALEAGNLERRVGELENAVRQCSPARSVFDAEPFEFVSTT